MMQNDVQVKTEEEEATATDEVLQQMRAALEALDGG
jgi:hypothetical protein